MAPTIESDENDLILKVITDAEQNLNCDFALKTEQKLAIHAICKGADMFTTKTPYYRSVDTMELSKIHFKLVRHRRMLFLVYRTYQTHDTFPQYGIIVTGVAAILLLLNSKIYISLVGN